MLNLQAFAKGGEGRGECRRLPPVPIYTPVSGVDVVLSMFPHIAASDWCGQHEITAR